MDISKAQNFKLSSSYSIAYSNKEDKADLINLDTTNLVKLEGFPAQIFHFYHYQNSLENLADIFNEYELSPEDGRKEMLKAFKFLFNEGVLTT